jgi:hypothetical protein
MQRVFNRHDDQLNRVRVVEPNDLVGALPLLNGPKIDNPLTLLIINKAFKLSTNDVDW